MFYRYGILLVAIVSVTTALPPCTCPRDMRPVCGSDGTTYNNECLLNCARSTNNEITLQKSGRCEEDHPCFCNYNYSPVCGTDGRTYGNECSLRCIQAKSPLLDVKHTGKCQEEKEIVQVAESPKEEVKVAQLPKDEVKVAGLDGVNVVNDSPCVCNRQMRPVCGTNGVTYNNPCLLNCASMKTGGSIHVYKEGACDLRQERSCTCTRDLKPVCGSDGVTYNNDCLLRCAGASMVHRGPCGINEPEVHDVVPF